MVVSDGVEIDVRATKDGVVIGLHDATLDRETSGSGPISEVMWDELADVTHYTGHPLAKLVDMLMEVDAHDGFVILDVRDVPAPLVKQALDAADFPYHFTKISVFDHSQGGSYIETLPGTQVFLKSYGLPNDLADDTQLAEIVAMGYSGVAFPTWIEFPSHATMEKIRSHGLFTFSFIAQTQADAEASEAVGIDYVISNANLSFRNSRGRPPALSDKAIDSQTLSFTTSTPRLFRRLFLEEYVYDTELQIYEWRMNRNLMPVRLAPTSYRFDIPLSEKTRGMYRVRVVEAKFIEDTGSQAHNEVSTF